MKMLLASLIIAAACSVGAAQTTLTKADFLKPQPLTANTWKPYTSPMSIASSAVCFGGSAADIISSQGLQENNRLLRNSRGEMSNARAMLTLAPCGLSYIFERKHPRAVALFRFAFGSVRMGLAIHNWRAK